MDYFNNVFTTFLGLERGSSIAVYGGSESSRISSKIFICVRKMNKGLTGLEFGVFSFFFLWTIPLKLLHHMAQKVWSTVHESYGLFYDYFMVIQSFLTVSSHCSLSLYEHNQWVSGLLLADGQTHPADDSNKSLYCWNELTDSRTYGHGHIFLLLDCCQGNRCKNRCGSTGRWSQRSKGHLESKSCCYASEFNYDPYGVMNTHAHTHTHTQSKSLWWRVKCVITTISFNYVNFPDNNNLGIFSRDLHILL